MKVVLILMLSAVLTGAAFANEWQAALADATALMNAGKTTEAIEEYEALSEAGNPLAQFSLAWMLKHGLNGLPSDRDKSCKMFIESAKHYVPVSLQEAGHCYAEGVIDSENPIDIATDYYQKAMESGLGASACDVLVMQNRSGKQLSSDYLNACLNAAQQSAVYAQEILVNLYADEKGLNDPQQALFWLEAAAQKSPRSAYHLAKTLYQNDVSQYSSALYWFETAAAQGYLPAYLETAALYFNQVNKVEDIKVAESYLAKAYLWSKAWEERTEQPAPNWVGQIYDETPKTWLPDLNKKVLEHVNLYAH